MKNIVLPIFCILMLAACQTAGPLGKKNADAARARPVSPLDKPLDMPMQTPMEITGSASTTMSNTPQMPTDPNVQVYPLNGPIENPLVTNRTHSVLDNTTAGGYTVFDDSVTVYPLPGEEQPAYMPNYAVPPLDTQYKPEAPHVGNQPMGLASAGILPPVQNVDVPDADPYAKPPVPGAVRQPLTLTAPGPLTMQPPAKARAPMLSPFADIPATASPQNMAGVPTPPPAADLAAARAATGVSVTGNANGSTTISATAVTTPGMKAGRRSGPLLTGY